MKRYRELDMPEVLRMLADNPNRWFAVRRGDKWFEAKMLSVNMPHTGALPYSLSGQGRLMKVYEIIEIPPPLIPLKKLEALRELYPKHEWIAMDEDNSAFIYSVDRPIPSDDEWESLGGMKGVHTLNGYAPDWRESLIHIPTEIERIKGLEAEA